MYELCVGYTPVLCVSNMCIIHVLEVYELHVQYTKDTRYVLHMYYTCNSHFLVYTEVF